MGRISKAYRTRFFQLLRGVGARRADAGADWWIAKAERISAEQHIPLASALTFSYEELASRPAYQGPKPPKPRSPRDIRFFCDAGVGGLARWIRAAGYEAFWESHIADDLLLKKASDYRATIITTDSMLMERRLLRDQVIPAFWLPPTLRIEEQLKRVFIEFHLSLGQPRCMNCGGELVKTEKESLRAQIPPRTSSWLDDYFVCSRCGKLFWHGTHWQRIQSKLDALGRPCFKAEPSRL